MQSVVSASPMRLSGIRTTAASAAPGRRTVWPPTVLSYWSQTQARDAMSGQPISQISAASMPTGSGTEPSGSGAGEGAVGR